MIPAGAIVVAAGTGCRAGRGCCAILLLVDRRRLRLVAPRPAAAGLGPIRSSATTSCLLGRPRPHPKEDDEQHQAAAGGAGAVAATEEQEEEEEDGITIAVLGGVVVRGAGGQ